MLLSVIQRSLALDAWLSTDELRSITPKLQRLPSLPSTYFEVLKQVESPSASVQNIGDVISRDPAVTARLLQVVNSAAFSLHQKVTDPIDAVSLLGVEMVKSLILCLQVFSQNDSAKRAGLSFDQLWEHSVQVARIAREITLIESRDARLANNAFTAGLLHDVGRIVLASNLPDDYAAVVATARKEGRPYYEAEMTRFGVTHSHVGAYLLGMWGMPAPLVEAAALHHVPTQSFTPEFSVLTAVHVADVLAHEQNPRKDGVPLPTMDLLHLKTLNLEDRPDAWRRALAGEEPAAANQKPKMASAPAKNADPIPAPKIAAPQPAAARQGNWFGWLLIPTTAVLAVAGIWLYLQSSGSNSALPVQARTLSDSAPAAAPATVPPAAAPATPAAPEHVSAPPQPEPAPTHAAVAVATPAPTPAPEAPAAPPVTNAAPPVVVAAATPFDSVKLQAIFYRSANPVVLINGKPLGNGDHINGLEVVSIDRSSVTLSSGSVQRVYHLK